MTVKMASQMGNEKRFSILPTKDPGDPGFLGPSYDPSDFIPLPGVVGVQRGDSLTHVVNALKGIGYYADTIGFGEPSFPKAFRSSYDVKVYGINYFMPTGIKCDNGADMFQYIETIPKGDAFGKAVQEGLKSTGLPKLRGLAPGAVEDAKSALNPVPIVRSLFGSGYAKCKLETKLVGDLYGRTGYEDESWIQGTIDTTLDPVSKLFIKTQTRWVSATDRKGNPITISKEQYDKSFKKYNPDGSPRTKTKESFANSESSALNVLFVATLAIGGMAALKIMVSK